MGIRFLFVAAFLLVMIVGALCLDASQTFVTQPAGSGAQNVRALLPDAQSYHDLAVPRSLNIAPDLLFWSVVLVLLFVPMIVEDARRWL